MRTNINIDDELLARAAAIAGTKTKTSTVEFALRELLRRQAMWQLMQWRDPNFDEEAAKPGREPSTRPYRWPHPGHPESSELDKAATE
jgi:Bacterial antitoxin of type II TA system, VapB